MSRDSSASSLSQRLRVMEKKAAKALLNQSKHYESKVNLKRKQSNAVGDLSVSKSLVETEVGGGGGGGGSNLNLLPETSIGEQVQVPDPLLAPIEHYHRKQCSSRQASTIRRV